jgi:hypothetical protein
VLLGRHLLSSPGHGVRQHGRLPGLWDGLLDEHLHTGCLLQRNDRSVFDAAAAVVRGGRTG